MKKYLCAVMLSMACLTVGAQNFGVGLDVRTDLFSVLLEEPDPQPATEISITDSSTMLKGYYFTPGILEFNAGLGFRVNVQEDPGDFNGDLIEDFMQVSLLAALGTNFHFIKGEFLEAGAGGQIKGTINLQPDGADAFEYIGAFTMMWEISFPVFLDIKFSDHLITRLSADVVSISIEHQRFETAPDYTVNSNEIHMYYGIRQYGVVFSFIYRI